MFHKMHRHQFMQIHESFTINWARHKCIPIILIYNRSRNSSRRSIIIINEFTTAPPPNNSAGILKNVQKACQSVTSNSFLAPKFIVLHHRTLLLPPTKPNPVDTHQRNHFANHFYHNSRWEIPHHHQPTIQASS